MAHERTPAALQNEVVLPPTGPLPPDGTLPRARPRARAGPAGRAAGRDAKAKRDVATLLSHSRSRSIASEMLQTPISPFSFMHLKWASLVIKI